MLQCEHNGSLQRQDFRNESRRIKVQLYTAGGPGGFHRVLDQAPELSDLAGDYDALRVQSENDIRDSQREILRSRSKGADGAGITRLRQLYQLFKSCSGEFGIGIVTLPGGAVAGV